MVDNRLPCYIDTYMGIRIHKVLGYGLLDYAEKRDDRFNPEWENDETLYEDHKEKFLEYLKRLKSSILSSEDKELWRLKFLIEDVKKLKTLEPHDFISRNCYNSEVTINGIVKPYPIVFSTFDKGWKRYDDTIDYHESKSMEDKIQLLGKNQIYPYYGFMDSRTGVPFNDDIYDFIRMWNDGDKEEFSKWYSRILLKEYIMTVDDFENYVHPVIPSEIVYLLRYLKVFKDDKTIHTLRPMVYTYWC